MSKIRVHTGCRDCAICTGHAFTGTGRSLGRGAADIASLGMTALVRRKCKACSHPMSEHGAQQSQPQHTSAPANWYPETSTGRIRWWDGTQWGAYKDECDAQQTVAAEAPAVDTGRLEQLAELHRTGALTDAEFTAAKARVLGL